MFLVIKPWRHPSVEAIHPVSQPTHNQFSPNLFHPLPNTHTHRPTCLHRPLVHDCLPHIHRHQRRKKSPSHLQHFSTPILLLWWPHQPPPTSPRPDIDRMRDCSVGTVQIGPQEGELACIWLFCMQRLHVDLTHHPQNDVWTHPNALKLHRPPPNIQKHRQSCLSCPSIHLGLPNSLYPASAST